MGRGGGVGEGSIAAPWPELGFRCGCDRWDGDGQMEEGRARGYQGEDSKGRGRKGRRFRLSSAFASGLFRSVQTKKQTTVH